MVTAYYCTWCSSNIIIYSYTLLLTVTFNTYSPFAASLAAYFVYQMATFIQVDVSSNTLSAAHLGNEVIIDKHEKLLRKSRVPFYSSFTHSLLD